ncbi:uncharacterized protein UHOD_03367 [Ustilago sp. UG-2017b]|nr:uncharacterized protein UHOD_03367 [Ustilago sp. UG-2017b]
MRSSATAGLTPQQLLDRRRAQNKLAQRRFREKARMSRSSASSSAVSYLSATSALPSFPPHLDFAATAPPRVGQVRIRSASSDSASSSFPVSLSSQVSSPTSSCTELNTPTMPTFNHVAMPSSSLPSLNGGSLDVQPVLVAHEPKPDIASTESSFYMPPPLTYFDPSDFASFDPVYPQPVPIVPSAAPLTYSSLASSSSTLHRNIGLKMLGMHSDAFLMSQPLPSLSLLSNAMLFSPHGTPQHVPHKSSCIPVSSFENLLRIPSRPSSSSASGTEEPSLSPLSSSSSTLSSTSQPYEPVTSTAVTSQSAELCLERAISMYNAGGSSATSTRSVAIASQSFARVIELLGARFGLDRNGQGLPSLLARLQLDGKLSENAETNKGLVFDACIDWDKMALNMLPVTEQLLYPHRAFIDACLPWPAVRSRLLKQSLTSPVCEQEFALDLLLSILSSDESLSTFHVYGDDVFDPEAWKLSEGMLTKWLGLFDDSIVRRTNWWRRQRGLPDLVIPTPLDSSNDSVRQGLGTGSLDQVHRLAATLYA